MQALTQWFDTIPSRRANIFFWTGLLAMLTALIAPVWIGTITPLTDFGGHLQMVDALVRGETLPALDSRVLPREEWLVPNLIPGRLAQFFYPMLGPNESLRLFLTLVVVSLAAALLFTLREFERPRAHVFVALPFFWGGMTGLGLLNYIGIYPLLFFALPLARRVGQHGTKTDMAWLVAVTMLAFFMHGVGFLFVIGLTALCLVLSLTDKRTSWRLLCLAPALSTWLFWFLSGPLSQPGANSVESATQRIRTMSLGEKLSAFRTDALDVLVGSADEVTLIVLSLILVGLFLGRSPARETRAGQDTKLNYLRQRPLLVMFLVSFLSVMVMPTYVGTILIDTRMITPTILLLCLLPRPLACRGLMRVLATAACLTTLGFGWSLSIAANLYEEREIRPLTELLESLPKGTRAECVDVGRVNTLFKRRPLAHNCNALIQSRRDSFAGGGFAYTRFNAVQFKRGEAYHSLRRGDWRRTRARKHWDYIVARGAQKDPPGGGLKRIHTTRSHHPLGTEWSLYQILR